MKAVSSMVAVILILMIAISLASSVYIFLSEMITTSTESGSEVTEHVSTSLLAEMKIESVTTAGNVTIKNTGKVSLTNFNVFVNNDLVTSSSITIIPGSSDAIDLGSPLNSGDTVKVTSAEGATAISTVP
jgi:FlaG/FlaF family flagellin (archaellin)